MCGYPSGSLVSWYLIPSCTFVCLGVCRGGGDNLKLMDTIAAAAAAAASVHAPLGAIYDLCSIRKRICGDLLVRSECFCRFAPLTESCRRNP